MTAPAFDFELDVLDPTLYVRGVAHEIFDWFRANDPVHWDERNQLWVISKYDDISYDRAPARGVLQRARASGRRAAAPATCRSSRWTIPSTPANAGS